MSPVLSSPTWGVVLVATAIFACRIGLASVALISPLLLKIRLAVRVATPVSVAASVAAVVVVSTASVGVGIRGLSLVITVVVVNVDIIVLLDGLVVCVARSFCGRFPQSGAHWAFPLRRWVRLFGEGAVAILHCYEIADTRLVPSQELSFVSQSLFYWITHIIHIFLKCGSATGQFVRCKVGFHFGEAQGTNLVVLLDVIVKVDQ